MKDIYFGSSNAHKIEEIKVLLPVGFRLITPKDVSNPPNPKETGDSILANAIIKAKAYVEATGLVSLADDTGLMVEALNGAPGVKTARYAGENATDEQNYTKLLAEMEGVSNRNAYFQTMLVVTSPNFMLFFEGILKGTIAYEPKGTNGFGYDPIFVYPKTNLTLAEMTMGEKNKISHRKKALAKFKKWLNS